MSLSFTSFVYGSLTRIKLQSPNSTTREVAAKRPTLCLREAGSEHAIAVVNGETALFIKIGEWFDPCRFNVQEFHVQIARAPTTRSGRESDEAAGAQTRHAGRPNSYPIVRDAKRI